MDYSYQIDLDELHSLIRDEISRCADLAYAEDGRSLYDEVVITTRDIPQIDRFIADAVAAFVSRTKDVCTPSAAGDGLDFDLPAFDPSNETLAEETLTRYIVLSSCSSYLRSHLPTRVEEYSAGAKQAMDEAVTYLKTLRKPSRQ